MYCHRRLVRPSSASVKPSKAGLRERITMITLQPMTPEEYQAYLVTAIAEYAQGHVEDGQWSADEALQRACEEFQSLLSDGVNTPNNYLFTLVNDDHQNVGMI